MPCSYFEFYTGGRLAASDMPGLVPNDVRDVRQTDLFVAPLG